MKKIADISLFESLGNSSAVGPSSDMSVFNRCEESLSGSLFYFGDPCYAVPDEEWQKFCEVLHGPGKI